MTKHWLVRSALGLLLMSIPLAACQSQGGSRSPQVKSYGNDGYLGITDVNPNLPTSPRYRTYRQDVQVMKDTLAARFPSLTGTTISLAGTTAHVRLQVPVGTPQAEVDRIRREASEALAAASPRYNTDIDVAVK